MSSNGVTLKRRSHSSKRESGLMRVLTTTTSQIDTEGLNIDQRIAFMEVLIRVFNGYIKKNPEINKAIKSLKGTSTGRSIKKLKQNGGGWLNEFDGEADEAQDRIKALQKQMADTPDAINDPVKITLIRDLRLLIKELKRWRKFYTVVEMCSMPLLSPYFTRALLAIVIHIFSFTMSLPAMGAATGWNYFLVVLSKASEPMRKMIGNIQGALVNPAGSSNPRFAQPGLCPSGTRYDPSLGCTSSTVGEGYTDFVPEGPEYTWSFNVAELGESITSSISSTLTTTVANPMHRYISLAFCALMLWRIHILAKEEERKFHQRLDTLRAVIRDTTLKVAKAETATHQARITSEAQVMSSGLALIGARGSEADAQAAIAAFFRNPAVAALQLKGAQAPHSAQENQKALKNQNQ